MNDNLERHFALITSTGATLRGDIRWNTRFTESLKEHLPVVIVCHGFKAFKDWGPFPAIGLYFAEHGLISIVINFSHNGIGENPRKFVEHEKFANNTISIEIDDIKTVLEEITNGCFGLPFVDRKRIVLLGHSRGGAIALITAKEDNRISAVVAWSTIAHFNRYTDEQKRRWREKGYIQLHSMSNHSLFRINTTLLDDVEQNAERLNIVTAVETLHKPLLIIHGSADIPAKIEEAEQLYAAADKQRTQFVRLEGAGHMYGAKHPYKEESPTLNHVLEITTHWIHTHTQREV